MVRICLRILLGLLVSSNLMAFEIDTQSRLRDSTLRIDYIFSGNAKQQSISVSELKYFKGWAGRIVNLDTIILKGNGQITMRSKNDNVVLYKTSFSSLFQEWLTTKEATLTNRAFENVFLLPMPKEDVNITIDLFDVKGNVMTSLTHTYNTDDILLRPCFSSLKTPHRYLLKSDYSGNAIDIAILAEGYQEHEMNDFYLKADKAVQAIFNHEPFSTYKKLFNVVAVGLVSEESGVSVPQENKWINSALQSNFSTFYSDRYLTTLHQKDLHDALVGIPYEHIIILANTKTYGGGGIYNAYTLTTIQDENFEPVVVHEFGHSFAGLADEYYYDDQFVEFYYPDVEPWEQNITTLKNFSSKWQDMLTANDNIDKTKKSDVGIVEGAGYQSKGVYRSAVDCRMKTNQAPMFCKVCQRAIERLISFYTK